MQAYVDRQLGSNRFALALLGLFAVVAAALAVIGSMVSCLTQWRNARMRSESAWRSVRSAVEFTADMNPDGSYRARDGEPYGPDALVWEYDPEPPERFYSWYISGAQRLPNGNTLVNQGAGAKLREVTSAGDIVWEYVYENEVDAPHTTYRANKYPVDYPGLAGLIPREE